MKKIRIIRTDDGLPSNIHYRFCLPSTINASKEFSAFRFNGTPVGFHSYCQAFNYVKAQIQIGNSFLTNLTFPTLLDTSLSLSDIFENSTARYNLLVDDEFVCFSPETFIKITDGRIFTFPMKGTIDANVPHAEDNLLNSEKETAEHHTIVDLLRNDLSINATDVKVGRFRYIDRIATQKGAILQVSSEISGQLSADYCSHLGDILFSMLPAGSVTGAPKKQTLRIIRQAEGHERGYYTGVFGVFDGFNLDSAVMIRYVEKLGNKLWFRSGGGITNMSIAESEYQELIDKVYVPFS